MAERNRRKNVDSRAEKMVSEITDILKLCPVENLYCAQGLILDVINGYPARACLKIMEIREAEFQFREEIYKSLITRREWGSNANKKFCSNFIGMGREGYSRLFKEPEKWIENEERNYPNLKFLLGTGMGLRQLFSSSIVKNYYAQSDAGKKEPFWKKLEENAAQTLEQRIARENDEQKGGEGEKDNNWFDNMREDLYSLLFRPEDIPVLEGWRTAWEDVKQRGGEGSGDGTSICMNPKTLRRMEMLRREFWDNHDLDWGDRIRRSVQMVDDFVEQQKQKTEYELQKLMEAVQGGQGDISGEEIYNLAVQLPEALQALKKLIEPSILGIAMKEWIPDYDGVKKKIREEYSIYEPEIEIRRKEYEEAGRKFFEKLLPYWMEIYSDEKEYIYKNLKRRIKDYIKQAEPEKEEAQGRGFHENEEMEKNSGHKLFQEALTSLLNPQAQEIYPSRIKISREAAEKIGRDADESLCFYLGWVEEMMKKQMEELLVYHMIKYLSKKV